MNFLFLPCYNQCIMNNDTPLFSPLAKQVVIMILLFCSSASALHADSGYARADNNKSSKRIEVYALSQSYWDTQYGDTLSKITHYLLPNNPTKRGALKQDILHLNPTAFINGDPAKLLSGKRLWLPGYVKQADSTADPTRTTVETYSWGNIKRPKN